MKKTFAYLITSILAFTVSISSYANDLDGDYHKIVLIDGAPYLVGWDEAGDMLYQIAFVPNYTQTVEDHVTMDNRMSEDYEAEKDNIKSRLLVFQEKEAALDYVAIDHIKDMARLYSKGYIKSINISAGQSDHIDDEALASSRIHVIYRMLKDLGVDDEGISADLKYYKSNLPNQFIRLNIK